MKHGKKIYFASDFHLGVPTYEESRKREKELVDWLEFIRADAEEVYLVGDIFDFWFEYKHTVPKGHIRLLGKLAELSDQGIKLHLFKGNHDMWMFDYLPTELGATIHDGNIEREWKGVKFLIGHGDGLGPGDRFYKFIKKVFANKLCQWAFERLHPNLGIAIANAWSKKSKADRRKNAVDKDVPEPFMGEAKEWLAIYCKEVLQERHFDVFIFGHRHLVIDIEVGPKSRYINLGEWFSQMHYVEFDGKDVKLLNWNNVSSLSPAK